MDLQAAALVALSVAKILLEPATYARVGALARLRFVDLSLIDDLADVGRAAWSVRYRVLEADALHADALFPTATLALVYEMRGRMLATLAHNLADDEQVLAKLDYIRNGTGYVDLANDLTGLAALYGQHQRGLADDKRHYCASDPADAVAFAGRIMTALEPGYRSELDLWRTRSMRASKVLLAHYDEAASVGRFLFRHDDVGARFPNLIGASRAPAAPKPPAKVAASSTTQASSTSAAPEARMPAPAAKVAS